MWSRRSRPSCTNISIAPIRMCCAFTGESLPTYEISIPEKWSAAERARMEGIRVDTHVYHFDLAPIGNSRRKSSTGSAHIG